MSQLCVAGLAPRDPSEVILVLVIRREALPEPAPKPKEAESITFKPFPEAKKFRDWWMHFIQKVVSASGRPTEANQWITEVEDANDETDLPITPKWQTLDVKIASGLCDCLLYTSDAADDA